MEGHDGEGCHQPKTVESREPGGCAGSMLHGPKETHKAVYESAVTAAPGGAGAAIDVGPGVPLNWSDQKRVIGVLTRLVARSETVPTTDGRGCRRWGGEAMPSVEVERDARTPVRPLWNSLPGRPSTRCSARPPAGSVASLSTPRKGYDHAVSTASTRRRRAAPR